MKIDRAGLGFRLLLPLCGAIAAIALALLVVVRHSVGLVVEDSHRQLAASQGAETRRLLEASLAELTAARLLENRTVVEAKQRAVLEGVALSWQRAGAGGVIARTDGAVLLSTLSPSRTARLLQAADFGFFSLSDRHEDLFGQADLFHPWSWRVVTVVHGHSHDLLGHGIFLLVPLVALGALTMVLVAVGLMRRNLMRPLAGMTVAVRQGQPVPATGVSELDVVGRAFNDAMGQALARAVQLADELEQRQQAQEALRVEKSKIEAIIAAIGDGISIQDRDFKILYQNQVHQDFLGSHLGERCHQAYKGEDEVCAGCPVAQVFADGRIHTVERAMDLPAGQRLFEITVSPLRDASGAIIAGVEVVRDITERRRVEEQLRHAQKMEGIGQLAGGIAHDFNNVLNVVVGYADLLKHSLGADDERQRYLAEIGQAAQRGASITAQILAFSRRQAVTIQQVEINELVAALHKMLRRLVREDIAIELALGPEPLLVTADPTQIDQVLINLATNARDAMPGGGTLRIETSRQSLDAVFLRSHGYGSPGDYALITVSDTGTGMDAPTRERIFEPFFTTKEKGQGTGLGMALVYGIVKKHNGYVNVYSEPGLGTVVKVFLPLAPESETARLQAPNAEVAALPGGNETILVAEDDSSLRELTRSILEYVGYQVVEAQDGQEAVEQLQTHGDRIRLVILDGIMPRKNGKEALAEMRAERPDLKAMVLSGYAEEVFTRSELEAMQASYLAKPVSPSVLLSRIREILDQ
ncbi:MAG: ATP-binding protein [Thermodesulfobacteriota bacterium]